MILYERHKDVREHVRAEGDRLADALDGAMKQETLARQFAERLWRRLEGLRDDGLSPHALAILDRNEADDADEGERLKREDAHAIDAFRAGLADGLPVRLI